MSDGSNTKGNKHIVFYDGTCDLCIGLRKRWGRLLANRGFEFIPLQKADTDVPFPRTELEREMKLRMADGRWFGGVDAYREFFRAIIWLRPLGLLLRFATPRRFADRVYRRIASTRHCAKGRCGPVRRKTVDRWIPLILLPTTVLVFRSRMEPWVTMWTLAFSLFAGCKWLTLRDAMAGRGRIDVPDALLFLFAWPGMNPDEFLNRRTHAPTRRDATAPLPALGRIVFAAILLRGILPIIGMESPLLRGWIAMFGTVCLLHFGLLDLMAWACRARGWNARPLMLRPLRSRTVAEFWGVRWNTAFVHLARHYLFIPTARWIGPQPAMVVVFLVSGLVHELVITVPADGGYGLPTCYFAIQAAGMLAGKRIFQPGADGTRTALRRAFTLATVAIPVGLLFPPVFVHNIILPMLRAFGIN